jgi:hypothetical protein
MDREDIRITIQFSVVISLRQSVDTFRKQLNPISIAGGLANPLVEVEYKGRQRNVIHTTQEESTLKIFGQLNYKACINNNIHTANYDIITSDTIIFF